MEHRLLRAIYALEFLFALVAALLFWNYVGGAAHLEYVAWYWKGGLSIGVAVCAVQLTTAGSRAVALKWLVILILLVAACGTLSYLAHLGEPQDQGDELDQAVITSTRTDVEQFQTRRLHW